MALESTLKDREYPMPTYALAGEDWAMLQHFPGGYQGVYVDVGCYKPIPYSNTFLFYEMGWRGLCIDANDFSAEFAAERPEDTFLPVAVGVEEGVLNYYHFPVDPTCNTFDQARAEDLMRTNPKYIPQIMPVPIRPLNKILAEQNITQLDILSIDIEWMDEAIIAAHDFSRWRPRLIAIEDHSMDLHNPTASRVFNILEAQGYLLESKCHYTSIYINPLMPFEKQKLAQAQANRKRLATGGSSPLRMA